MSGSSKNQLSHLRLIVLTVIGFIVVTLAACGSAETGEQQEQTEKASANTGTTDTTAGATTEAAAMGGEMEATGMDGGMTIPNNVPRLPPVMAYYEGEEIFFVHPEASDKETADLLTNMMGSPVLVVPELEQVPEEALSKVYVFTNGIKGDGPLGFQPDVFDSAPGDENYSPLRRLYLVTWKDEGEAREIKTLRGVIEARESGEVEIERQDTVINEPFLTWPGGQR